MGSLTLGERVTLTSAVIALAEETDALDIVGNPLEVEKGNSLP
jgi:hypothetical protein